MIRACTDADDVRLNKTIWVATEGNSMRFRVLYRMGGL
jgi:hypothetical protein